MADVITLHSESPLLVFGGPYSNLEATRAVFDLKNALGIPESHTICTGDVVAYAASPEQTADLIRQSSVPVIAGNCEEQLAENADDCGCGFETGTTCDRLSRSWYAYARERISQDTREWMRGLPSTLAFTYGGYRFRVLHGGVHRVNRFIFESDSEVIAEEFAGADADIVLAGHAGVPFAAPVSNGLWLNAGVVGMPANDGTPDGWYALIEPQGGPAPSQLRISLRRLAYDYAGAADHMTKAGYANAYAQSLINGLWPSVDVMPESERSRTGHRLDETTMTFGGCALGRGASATATHAA